MKNNELLNLENYYAERNRYEQSFVHQLNHKERIKLHPLLLSIIKYRNKKSGFKLVKLADARKKPKIFCITHIGKFDIEIVSELIGDHYYLLSGDFENIKGTVEEKFLGLNGVIYVREDDKNDRKKSKEKMINILKQGGNLMYFPEGTWNLSPNLPVLQCPYGIIDVAMKANATIIPVAIEQYGEKFIAKVGNNFDIEKYNEEEKIIAINDLRSEMATLKWEIWESLPIAKRSQISDNEFNLFINERLKEWPNFSLEEFQDRVFKPKGVADPQEVFNFLETIELGRQNAFLQRDQMNYNKRYMKKR